MGVRGITLGDYFLGIYPGVESWFLYFVDDLGWIDYNLCASGIFGDGPLANSFKVSIIR